MLIRRKVYCYVLVPLVCLIIGVVVWLLYRSEPSGLEKVTLELNWTPNGTHAAYYTARSEGFYREEGLEVEILDGSGSATTIKVVGSGAQTFGLASGESIAIGRSRGVPIISIAAFYQRNPACLFALADKGIRRPQDLVGSTVGVNFGSSTYPMYRAMLREVGLDPTQIKEVSIGLGVEPLLNG